MRAIADYLEKPVGEVRLLLTRPVRGKVSLVEHANGDCVFFDGATRRCTIYPVRPPQCRTWPFWHGNIDTPEDWRRTQQGCPGAGRGELVPLEEIEKRVRESGL